MQWIEQHVGSWSFMRSAKEWQLGRFWCWRLGMGPMGVHQEYVCGFSYSF